MSSAPLGGRRRSIIERVQDAVRTLMNRPRVYVTRTDAEERVAGWLRPNVACVNDLESLLRQRIEARGELAIPENQREAWLAFGRDAEAREMVKLFHALHRSIPASLASQEETQDAVN